MADHHQLGTAQQRMGPLTGTGGVSVGFPVECGSCSVRFVVDERKLRGAHDVHNPYVRELWCPCCGSKLPAKPVGHHVMRPMPLFGLDD